MQGYQEIKRDKPQYQVSIYTDFNFLTNYICFCLHS